MALVRISGDRVTDVLAKVCAIDLADAATPDGTALRTTVAGVVTDIVRDDTIAGHTLRSYLLACERSTGQYLFDTLLESGGEYGLDIDGFTTTPGT